MVFTLKIAEDNYSSGSYVRQSSGYEAFIPKPLPLDPRIHHNEEVQTQLAEANIALGRLDGLVQLLPAPYHFVLMHARREAVLSSQIEGTQSTLYDLLKAEAEVQGPDQVEDVAEVMNYVKAMKRGLELLSDLPVASRLILAIHAILMDGARGAHSAPGEFRRIQNWIGQPGSTPKNASFVPPPPQEVLNCIGDLEKYINSTEDNMPDIIRIGLIHAQFETIHPFLDGNGRVGRLLITLLLCERKILTEPVLYISRFFLSHRAEYYKKLQGLKDRDGWRDWLKYFLRAVAETSAGAADTISKVLALREGHRSLVLNEITPVGNALKVLEHLYGHPIVSVAEVSKITGTGHHAANKIVSALTTAGILAEIPGRKRNRQFFYEPYVQLFEESRDAR